MVTETTTQSWSSRVGGSFKGIFVGLVLIVVSVALLFWNEGRTIKQAKALTEGAQNTVEANADSIDPSLEGKLVHLSGNAVTDDVLTDPYFSVSLNAIKLARKVEIYQWKEEVETHTERDSGGRETTTKNYSYQKTWSEELIDSSSFKESSRRQNPTSVPINSEVFVARNVALGAYSLSPSLIDRIGPEEVFTLPPYETPEDSAPETQKQSEPTLYNNGADSADATDDDQAPSELDYLNAETTSEYEEEFDSASQSARATYTLHDFVPLETGFYKGDPDNVQIGDIRVTYKFVPSPTTISIVSKQSGATFVPYLSKTKKTIELLSFGTVSAEEMFQKEQHKNKIIGWLIRIGGVFLMYMGFGSVFKPLSVIADVVPFAGRIVEFGAGVVAFSLTLCISLVTIAVGWLSYRPIVAVPLLIIAIAALAYPFIKGKKKNT